MNTDEPEKYNPFWETNNLQKTLILIGISGLLGLLISIWRISSIDLKDFITALNYFRLSYISLLFPLMLAHWLVHVLIWYSLLRILEVRISPWALILIYFIGSLLLLPGVLFLDVLITLLLLRLNCRKNIFSLFSVIVIASLLNHLSLIILSIPGLSIVAENLGPPILIIISLLILILPHVAIIGLLAISSQARKDMYKYLCPKILVPIAFSFLIVIFEMFQGPLLLYASGESISILPLLIKQPVLIFISQMPISVAGFGTTSTAYILIFGDMISQETIMAVSIISPSLKSLFIIILGFISIFGLLIFRFISSSPYSKDV
jgi:uncharacterized membrane protein YbhN (UPF0104 family)